MAPRPFWWCNRCNFFEFTVIKSYTFYNLSMQPKPCRNETFSLLRAASSSSHGESKSSGNSLCCDCCFALDLSNFSVWELPLVSGGAKIVWSFCFVASPTIWPASHDLLVYHWLKRAQHFNICMTVQDMSNDGAWLMISSWIFLNVSWATSTNCFCASHTGHGLFLDNSECISCITQPKYDHFWFLSRLTPTEYLDILGQYAFFKHAMMVKFVVDGSPFTDQLVANGWSHFCPLHSVHTKFLQHRFWALLAVQLSGHWRPLPSWFGSSSKRIQSFLHQLRFWIKWNSMNTVTSTSPL